MNRKVTSRDVAKAAGVSQSLVSLILNNVQDVKIKPETRQHVLEVALSMNYRINMNARNMKTQRSGTIGLLSSWDTNSFVFPMVMDGIQAECSEKNTAVVVCTGKVGLTGNPDYIDYYLQNRIDGLLYISYVGVTREGVIGKLEAEGMPFVCIIGARDIPNVSCVDVSFLESGYLAGKHLLEKGYTKPAFEFDTDSHGLLYAEQERVAGFVKCMKEANIEVKYICFSSDKIEICEKDIIKSMQHHLLTGSFDSYVSTSLSCSRMLKAAAQINIAVPEKLGVISLDNELFAPYLYPSLTTVDEPLEEIAAKAVNILFDKIEGKAECFKLELTPSLTVRESTYNTNLRLKSQL